MHKNALLALVIALAAAPGQAQEPCQPAVPAVASELADAELPTDEARWRAIEDLWTLSADAVQEDVKSSLRNGSISPAADLIQGRLNAVTREAIRGERRELVRSLLEVWRLPLATLSRHDRILAYWLTPDRRVSEARLDRSHEMWVGADGVESVLYSAMYLAGATDLARTVAGLPEIARTPDLTEFSRAVSTLALDHYRRWVFGPPGIWQVRGWGCDASGLDLVEFTQRRMAGTLGNGRVPFCTAPTDIDMLIAIGIANLLTASKQAPTLVAVPESDRRRLTDVLRLKSGFMASRVTFGKEKTIDGRTVETAQFDAGTWSLHPDLLAAANDSAGFPLIPIAPKAGVGWDFSHGARIAWTALTLAEHSAWLGSDTVWERFADGLARQVGLRVLDDSGPVPRFRNYLDGSNGWYRVDPIRGTGVPPFGLSRAFLAMPWARLSARDARLTAATGTMWRALARPGDAQCAMLKQVYVDDSFWQARKPAGAPISGRFYNVNLLPFLATSPVRPSR